MYKRKVWLLVQGDIFCYGLRVHLQHWGFEVVEEPFWQGSVLKLTADQEPDLIILDYKTRFSGQEAALLTGRHTVPILFLVTNAQALKVPSQQAQMVNSYCCLPKPCPLKDLQKAVANLLGVTFTGMEAPEEMVSPLRLPLLMSN
jgi:DNA-binding NarL/FixJ family response regulator